MNAKERYDKLIEAIEDKASNPFMSAQEIADFIADEQIMSLRDINTIMKFLAETSAIKYITRRKIMAAYRYLISSKKPDIQEAVAIAGRGTHSSLNRDFSEIFGLTPTEAIRSKDRALLELPLTWDAISCDRMSRFDAAEEVEEMDKLSVFGISSEQYAKVMEASDLADLYGLDREKSNLAFELSEELSQPLKDTFRYVNELNEYCAGTETIETADGKLVDGDFHMETMVEEAHDASLQFLFFSCGLPLDLALEVADRICVSDEELVRFDPELIAQYAYTTDMSFSYFFAAYDYYKTHADNSYDEDNLDYYVELICQGLPKEEAFAMIIPFGDFDMDDAVPSDEEQEEEWQHTAFDRMADEETAWRNRRIDIEYDPDNIAYEIDEHNVID